MQVEAFLEQSAVRSPGKLALVCGDRRLTYAEVDRGANRLARGLLAGGVSRGDRVAIYLENSVEAVLAIFAALKCGAAFMVLNPTTKADKLAFVLRDSRASAIVTDARRAGTITSLDGGVPHVRAIVVAGAHAPGGVSDPRLLAFADLVAEARDASKPPNRSIDIDLAALIYTSGSTGTPKGVMLTHHNVVSAATSITTYLENVADDVILDVLPLSFDYGLYQVLMAFKVGATVVLERSFAYPHAVLQTVATERVTGLPIVPTISALLLQIDLGSYDLSCVRYLTNTAAALPTAHIKALRARLPHVRIYSMYGLTECKRVSYLPPDEIDARPDSVGRAMPNEEVYVVDEQGQRLTSGVGELVIRGSNVMAGYWERPEETDRVLRPGPIPGERVLHSGDLFRMDGDGYLYFLGRMDDIIKSRGEKVSPREVENALYELPGVAEAAVVGVPDAVLGQAVKAVVTLQEGADIDERQVLRHCAERLENFMMPKIVEIRTAMPKTPSGKIDKKTLHLAEAG